MADDELEWYMEAAERGTNIGFNAQADWWRGLLVVLREAQADRARLEAMETATMRTCTPPNTLGVQVDYWPERPADPPDVEPLEVAVLERLARRHDGRLPNRMWTSDECNALYAMMDREPRLVDIEWARGMDIWSITPAGRAAIEEVRNGTR